MQIWEEGGTTTLLHLPLLLVRRIPRGPWSGSELRLPIRMSMGFNRALFASRDVICDKFFAPRRLLFIICVMVPV